MKILESPLLGEFIAYLNWSGRSRVDLRRRRLRQLVTKLRAVTDAAEGQGLAVRDASFATWLHMLRAEALRGERVLDAASCDAAAVAGSTRRFLSGIRELVVSSADVDRLADAVEELERLAGPGGDLDLFVKVLRLHDARSATASMDVDGGCPPPVAAATATARHLPQEGSSSGSSSQGSTPGGKRKRAGCSSGPTVPSPGAKRKLPCCCGSNADGGPTPSVGQLDTIDHRKRRVLAWVRPHHWFPALGGLFAAPRDPQPPPPQQQQQAQSARTVAMAMARVRGRIGRRRRQQPYLRQELSRLSL
ncbi:hypothetical protein QOZ80_1BG0059390 [Eleusine coracana subsp. coracana]|nr:hypothetical protein QOZ80_1BG0059390 [Eleusine coracana subsp. coracana]